MKEFVSHIDYLIQKHDCVIIPDFGGFVLSHEGASFGKDGAILPPKITVGFNSQLKSNDGLLAESYMTMYSITYDEACKRIEEAVTRLNTILSMRHPVQIARLGKLSLDENNCLIFDPNNNLSIFHPETFGLGVVNIKRLSYIEEESAKAKRSVYIKRALVGIGAAAAAVLMFFVASTPVSQDVNIQKSSFFTDLVSVNEQSGNTNHVIEATLTQQTKVQEIAKEPVVQEEVVFEKPANETVMNANSERNSIANVSTSNYFVVIAGATTDGEANTLMSRFKAEGFDVNVIKSKQRIRIYVASFSTSEEADTYLNSFKQANPKFSDAWVYFQE
jgi:Sporulation related domain.